MVANDIINAALRLAGIKASGETPTADESNDALTSLNAMLASWSADNLLQSGYKLENFPLTTGTGSYAIGTGKTFNTAAPITIEEAFVRDTNGYDYPLDIKTMNEYYSLPDIGVASFTGIPEFLAYDPGMAQQTTQSGTIFVYPAPDASSTYTLYIRSLKYFTPFASLTDTFTFPTAYELPIKTHLAILIAPEYGCSISAELAKMDDEAMKTIINMNSKQAVMQNDLGKKPYGNIYTFR